MGFIENLRKSVEGKLEVGRQGKSQEAALQAGLEKQRRIDEANRKEFHRKRREQTKAFRKDSGIEALLTKMDQLIKLDPAKDDPKGHVALFTPRGVSSDPVSTAEFVSVSPGGNSLKRDAVGAATKFRYELTHDEDAIFDVIVIGTETKKPYVDVSDPYNNRYSSRVDYFMVETNPDGDIVFHSKQIIPATPHSPIKYVHNSIPATVWRSDKERLESELGQAFINPDSYSVTYEVIPRGGYRSGFTG